MFVLGIGGLLGETKGATRELKLAPPLKKNSKKIDKILIKFPFFQSLLMLLVLSFLSSLIF